MSVTSVNCENWDTVVQQAELPVVVDFYTTWCGPCRMMAVVLDELAKRFAGKVIVAKVNIEDAPELAQRFDVRAVPTLAFMKDGEVIELATGFQSPQALDARLTNLLQPATA